MLKLILPITISTILMSKYSWLTTMINLLLLTTVAILWIMPSTTPMSVSTMTMMDPMSSFLSILSILIAAMMILASNKIYFTKNSYKLFLSMNLTLLLILVLCFNSNSLMMFYIWFEASLIPTLMIIAIWGYQPERIQAGMYLMMYTITASLPMLMLFMMIYNSSSTMMMFMNFTMVIPIQLNMSIFWFFLVAGFIVKLPMFMVHLWLPKAHVEAPIAGSMVLAAILLKLGGYGLLRMVYIFPNNLIPNKILMSVALYGAFITSLICLRQPDMKSMIAYSSVGHMGIMLTGLLSYSSWGMTSTLMMMIAHGLCSSALFIMVNLSYSMTHTRSVYLTKGMLSICPTLSMWWFLLLSVNMAAPPSFNLLSEIMLMTAIASTSTSSMLILALLSFFTAAYSLHLFAITQHGQSLMMLNPSASYKKSDMLLLFIHLTPIILLVMKPDLMN